jgi:hypothetical protein
VTSPNFYLTTLTVDPRFNSPERQSSTDLLEPVTRAAVAAIIADAKAQGIELQVTETFRSEARQQQLYDQGATQLEHVGTHGFGIAADFCKIINGEASWAGDWSFLAVLAKKHGLVSGFDWGQPGVHHSFVDSDHCQRCRVSDQAQLFAGTWFPDSSYNPYGGAPINAAGAG